MITAEALQRRIAQRKDPRYRRVIERFLGLGLLTTNARVPETRAKVAVSDALWVAEIEPRVAELLPALLVRRPAVRAGASATRRFGRGGRRPAPQRAAA